MAKKHKREPKETLGKIYQGPEIIVIREKHKGSPCKCSNPRCDDRIMPDELIMNIYDWRIGQKIGSLHAEDSELSCLKDLLGGEINMARLKEALIQVPSVA